MVGLGAMARDSIADMSKLIDCTDKDPEPHEPGRSTPSSRRQARPRSSTGGLNGSWTCPSRNESFDPLISFDDSSTAATETENIVHEEIVTILNDGIAAQASTTTTTTTTSSSSSSIQPQDRPVTPLIPTVSATNTRSLDSYRSGVNNNSTITNNRATKSNLPLPSKTPASQTYAGFSYEGYNYADYYSEDSYAIGGASSSSFDSYDDSVWGRKQEEEEENVFCCLFAPWMKARMRTTKSIQNGVLDSTSSSSSSSKIVAQSTEDVVVERTCPPPHQLPDVDTKSIKSLKEKDNSNDDEDDGNNVVNPQSSETTTSIISTSSPRSQPSLDEELVAMMSVQTMRLDSDLSATSVDIDDTNRSTAAAAAPLAAIDPQAKEEQGNDKPPASPPLLPQVKGILKVRRCTMEVLQKPKPKRDTASKPTESPTGRKLFPTYEPKKTNGGGSSHDRSVDFIPMARVLTIPSRREMPLGQRARIWWQKCDYDEFKKTGRIISKAMECGGSEVWLTSSNAWGDRSARGGVGKAAATTTKTTTTPDAYTRALSKYVRNDSDDSNDSDSSLVGEGGGENKWWCKFGHSRRGLEHVVSSSEGKARQSSVQLATQMVLDEQRRQRLSRTKDPNKLRNVAMQYTSWAQNLALASGFADAESVKTNFDATESTWGGNRAKHFAKRMNSNLSGGMGGGGSLAALIIQEVDVKDLKVGVGGGSTRVVTTAVTSQILDANTHTTATTTASNNKAKSVMTRHTKVVSAVGVDEDITTLSSSEDVSLKKRAKGFIPGRGDENTLMMGMRTVTATS